MNVTTQGAYQARIIEETLGGKLIPSKVGFGEEIDIRRTNHERYTHDLFKFPAKFHPPLCRWAIHEFSRPGECVLDPMMGVGTVLVESKVAGRSSVGIDIDPLSVFIARVKTTPVRPSELLESNKLLLKALRPLRRPPREIELRKRIDISQKDFENASAYLDIPDFPNPVHWFRRYVLIDLALIRREVRDLFSETEILKDFYMACLGAGIRRVSNADPTPVSGLEVTKHMKMLFERGYEIDVFHEFERRVKLNTERMRAFHDVLQHNKSMNTPTLAFRADVRCLSAEWQSRFLEPPIFAMTSPPYCNAIEYWRRHRLEYLWLGLMNWNGVRELSRSFVGSTTVTKDRLPDGVPSEIDVPQLKEVVGHLSELDKRRKAALIIAYFMDSTRYIQQVANILQPGGKFMIVVGNSRTNGILIPTSEILLNIAVRQGFGIVNTFHYLIKNRIMQYPAAGAGVIPREWVIILER